jgi:hypothetical protein
MSDHSGSPSHWNDHSRDLELARQALARLAQHRADDRDQWLRVGMACHATADELLGDWITFSRRSEKFREGECEREWKSFKRNKSNPIGLGTLIQYARMDSGDQSFAKRAAPGPAQERLGSVEEAARLAARSVGGVHVATWKYAYADGRPCFWVIRIDLKGTDAHGKQNKTMRPIRPSADGGFEIAAPKGPLPLYRMPQIPRSGRIYLTEGEKACDAIAALGMPATTTAHGASAVNKSDITPLVDLDVVILADNDREGARYAERLSARIRAENASAHVRVLNLPGLPVAGDAVEFIAAARERGMTDAEIVAEIESLVERAGRSEERRAQTKRCLKYIPFPIHLIPNGLREFVLRASESIGCDPAFIALPLLAAAASAIGNTRRIRLKQGWCEPAILWALIVALSGMQKSPAFGVILRVIDELQRRALLKHADALEHYKKRRDIYEVRKRQWMRKGEGDPPEEPKEPFPERLYCSDATIEAIAPLLLRRWRGLMLLRDELSAWILGFDKYRGGRGGDAAHWLEFHGARPILIDRKSGDPKTIHVPRAAVSITGGIQPGVLARSLGDAHFENGLAARFLLAYPPRRARKWTEVDIPAQCETELLRIFERLYDLRPDELGDGTPVPRDIDLSADAKRIWIDFFNEHGNEQAALTGDLAAAWAKIEGYAARLALIIHYLKWAVGEAADDPSIDAESMSAGIELARWFGNEAKRTYEVLRESDDEQELRQLAELIDAQGGSVRVRDWQRQRKHTNSEAAEEDLQRLLDAGYGSWGFAPTSADGGRPSRVFTLHANDPRDKTPDGSDGEGDLSRPEQSDAQHANDGVEQPGDRGESGGQGSRDKTPNADAGPGELSEPEVEHPQAENNLEDPDQGRVDQSGSVPSTPPASASDSSDTDKTPHGGAEDVVLSPAAPESFERMVERIFHVGQVSNPESNAPAPEKDVPQPDSKAPDLQKPKRPPADPTFDFGGPGEGQVEYD